MSAAVPEGLTELLEEFAVAVLRARPPNLVDFAARYFNELAITRKTSSGSHTAATAGKAGSSGTSAGGGGEAGAGQGGGRTATGPGGGSATATTTVPSIVTSTTSTAAAQVPAAAVSSGPAAAATAGTAEVEMDAEQGVSALEDSGVEDEECLPPPSYRENMGYRRKSVFAESYDPTAASEPYEKVVHPKTDEQRRRLVEAVQNMFLFHSLDNEQMTEVLDAMFEKKVQVGEHVIEQGDDGDNFYVVDSGKFDVFASQNGMEPKLVFNYDGKGSFGELALMYNTPRAATVVATTEGVLWALDRTTFRRIICDTASRKRQTYQSFLESIPMLKSLEPYELMNLADGLHRKHYSAGECIIKQGDVADAFYIVEEGMVQITREDPKNPGQTVDLSTCSRGEYFGELALLTHKARAASVTAVGDVTCAALDVAAFERVLGPCMEVMKRNFEHYEEQLMQLFGTTLDITDAQ